MSATPKAPNLKAQVVDLLQTYTPFRKDEVVSVRKGRGTTSSWVYLKLTRMPSDYYRGVIETLLRERGICGSYLSDSGPGDHVSSNLHIEAP